MDGTPARGRITELADACVQCGLCLPYCPTYALDRTETESPRGRIALFRHAADGSLALEPGALLHLDHCLGCMACERVCPVPVQYGELLTTCRAAWPPATVRPRRLLHWLTRPGWLRFGIGLARVTGAPHWLPPLAQLLPRRSPLRTAIALLPTLPTARTLPTRKVAPASAAHARVALFGGCIQGALERGAQNATRQLLVAAGFAVTRIDGRCCGALAAHTGEAAYAGATARRVGQSFAASGVGTLLTATPGCLGSLRADLPDAQVDDAMAFLDLRGGALKFRPLPRRAVLHLPCTQVNVARAGAAVRRLLARVPGLVLDVLPTEGMCCGAAGSHMLEFPERAAALREHLLGHMPKPAPDLLLTANIGCRLYLGAGFAERGLRIEVEHPLTLLARQLDP